MPITIHHNKKRNAALLYEFLLQHMTNCVVENNNKDASRALSLLKKYFYSGDTPLRGELKAFNLILNSKISDKNSLKKILNEVCRFVKTFDIRESNRCKSELIKEINHSFGKATVWQYKIPNYKPMATIQALFNSLHSSDIENNIERIQLEDLIVEGLSTKASKRTIVENIKVNPKYSRAIYKFAMKRFNEKYGEALNENQIRLLTKYATYTINENKQDFVRFLTKEIENVATALKNIKDPLLKEDKKIQDKILECQNKLRSFDINCPSDAMVTDLLRFQALEKELANN